MATIWNTETRRSTDDLIATTKSLRTATAAATPRVDARIVSPVTLVVQSLDGVTAGLHHEIPVPRHVSGVAVALLDQSVDDPVAQLADAATEGGVHAAGVEPTQIGGVRVGSAR